MADIRSTQYTQVKPPNYAPLKPNEKEGRERIFFAEIVFSGALNGDVILWGTLPKGARLVGGRLIGNANGAGVTFTLGDTGSAARFLAATAYNAATTTEVANTYALSAGYEFSAETVITSTIGGGNPTNATKLMVILKYVVD
jgi:hypothetical protein